MISSPYEWSLSQFSFAYLYEGPEIRPEFPNLRRFGALATHDQAVRSPGTETISAATCPFWSSVPAKQSDAT